MLVLALAPACAQGGATSSTDGGAPLASSFTGTMKPDAAAADLMPSGKPFDLKVADTVTYCDDHGAWTYDTVRDTSVHSDRTCPAEEDPDVSCSCGGKGVRVRNPGLGSTDTVDTDDGSFPLSGRVRDCACVGKTLYIAVADKGDIFVIAGEKKPRLVAHAAAERLAASSSWIAWTDGKKVHATRR